MRRERLHVYTPYLPTDFDQEIIYGHIHVYTRCINMITECNQDPTSEKQ